MKNPYGNLLVYNVVESMMFTKKKHEILCMENGNSWRQKLLNKKSQCLSEDLSLWVTGTEVPKTSHDNLDYRQSFQFSTEMRQWDITDKNSLWIQDAQKSSSTDKQTVSWQAYLYSYDVSCSSRMHMGSSTQESSHTTYFKSGHILWQCIL